MIVSHMINPLRLIEGIDSRCLFLALSMGWENEFVLTGKLFRRPLRMKQLHGTVRMPRANRECLRWVKSAVLTPCQLLPV